MKKKILIGIPCYNCENQISLLINEIDNSILDKVDKILILDNCSLDKTLEVAKTSLLKKEDKEKFILAKNKLNYGLGGSHKTIFNFSIKSGFDYTIILHGDNQAKTSEINDMINILYNEKAKDYDALLGSRFMKGSTLNGYSLIRTVGNIILNIIYSVFLRKKIFDLGSGLNLYKNSMLSKIDYLKFDNQFTFNMDLLINMTKKFNINYFPITWSDFGQISNANAIKVGLKTLSKIFFKDYEQKDINFIFSKIEINE